MRFGWPRKSIPNISWASRSCQFAPAKTPTRLAIRGWTLGRSVVNRTMWPAVKSLTATMSSYRSSTGSTRGSPTCTSMAQSTADSHEKNTRPNSSRAVVRARTQSSEETLTLAVPKVIVSSPRVAVATEAASSSRLKAASDGLLLTPVPLFLDVLASDLLLKKNDPFHQGLRSRRAAGYVDVHGNELIDP